MYQSSAAYSQWCLYYPSYDHPRLGEGWAKDFSPERKADKIEHKIKLDKKEAPSCSEYSYGSKSPSCETSKNGRKALKDQSPEARQEGNANAKKKMDGDAQSNVGLQIAAAVANEKKTMAPEIIDVDEEDI